MRDFFRSEPYIKYRAVLTNIIDSKTAELVTTKDMDQIPRLQAEVRMMVFVRDELPAIILKASGTPAEPPLTGEGYDAPEEENVEAQEAED